MLSRTRSMAEECTAKLICGSSLAAFVPLQASCCRVPDSHRHVTMHNARGSIHESSLNRPLLFKSLTVSTAVSTIENYPDRIENEFNELACFLLIGFCSNWFSRLLQRKTCAQCASHGASGLKVCTRKLGRP